MRKCIIFAGFMGMIMVGAVNAQPVVNSAGTGVDFPSDTATHPTFDVGQTGELNGNNAYVIKDPNIKVATTKYVGSRVNDANTGVQALDASARTQRAQVTTNAGNVSDMQTNKQTIATGNCNNLDTNLYSGCGYIAPNGANVNTNAQANYTWVKIKNSTLLLDSPGTPQYDPTPQYNP
jgi:hypothetical protein